MTSSRRRSLVLGLLIMPVEVTRAGWRRSAPLRWSLRHPRTYRALRRQGFQGTRVMAELSRWFTPGQVTRLGWSVEALSYATEVMERVTGAGWDAEAFIRTVRAGGRDLTLQLTNWSLLHRLGVDDPALFLEYLAADADPALAVHYALGRPSVPYDVLRAVRRGGVTNPWRIMAVLREEYRVYGSRYPGGWPSIVAWLDHAGHDLLRSAWIVSSFTIWEAEPHLRPWREWTVVGERNPHPALWYAAGFTVDEALAMIDAGEEPDEEVLLGLAALRRTG